MQGNMMTSANGVEKSSASAVACATFRALLLQMPLPRSESLQPAWSPAQQLQLAVSEAPPAHPNTQA